MSITNDVQTLHNTVGFENLPTPSPKAAELIESALTALKFSVNQTNLHKSYARNTQTIQRAKSEMPQLLTKIKTCESTLANCEAARGRKRAVALFATALVASVIALAVLTGLVFAPHSGLFIFPMIASVLVNVGVGIYFDKEINGPATGDDGAYAAAFGFLVSLYYAICPYSYSERKAPKDKLAHEESIKSLEEQSKSAVAFLSTNESDWKKLYQENFEKLNSHLSEQIQVLEAALLVLDSADTVGPKTKIDALTAAQTFLREINAYLKTETENRFTAV